MKRRNMLLGMLLSIAMMTSAQTLLPYQNSLLSAEARAQDLLSRLTIEEKASLMQNGSPAISRLGVPQFEWWGEGLHGLGRNGFATVYPATIGMAASFDNQLLYQVFSAVSDEFRAKNNEARHAGIIGRYQGISVWTPNINIFRDPRWGRGQETYGEDPYLTSIMGLAVVDGLQGQTFDGKPLPEKYQKLLACAKHFAVHSGPEWNRHTFNIENLPARDLWETYLPAFKVLVQQGHVGEVMCAYQRIDGEPCCANARYERQILRDEWGFRGIITSDCGAIRDFYVPGHHDYVKTPQEAATKAVVAGTDVECGSVYHNIPAAVKNGMLAQSQVDSSLMRLLVARFRLGDFDSESTVSWQRVPSSVIASKAHKELALQMAHESIVLLQNRHQVLPLNKHQRILVIGPNANDSVMQWGNYTGYPTATSTILEGIREKASQVTYFPGCTHTRNEVSQSYFNLITTPEGKPGLKISYYNNKDMQGTPVTTVVATSKINLSNGGNTVFAQGVNLEEFSARLEGNIKSAKDETLTLNLGCDDGYRLIVDGDTIAQYWQGRNRVLYANKELRLKAGVSRHLVIEYFQNKDMAMLQFDVAKKYTPTREEILSKARQADVIVFVGGISPYLEGEEMKVDEPGFKGGDRTDIQLPAAQRNLIATLSESGKPMVYVNCSGSAIALVPESQHADALVQAWYPGERGGEAVADVLFGDYNPSGKLPVTFYKSTDELPDFLDYTMKNRTYRYFRGEALYPFGHGLSYTTFAYGKPRYQQGAVTFTLTNTGKKSGTEIAQVYIRRTADAAGPIKSLRACQRISLQPGESRQVSILLPRSSFECWDAQTNTMRVLPGQYQLFVGGSSDTQLQTATVIR